jgi:light-regulated signal transduction histidine kinase (bacteriophytochrome)
MVGSYVQLLAKRYRGRLDADADEFIGYAVEGAQRMRVLINDLLALSRVGTRPAVRTQVALADVLADVQANLGVAIAEAGATITHDPLPTIVADRGLLMHLLQNLISNAVKFRGDAPPAVHVGVALEPGRWVLSVRDNGIGIDPRHEDRIFQVFQRLHTRDRYPGTGIGLALCRKIAEVHGGTIWMRSVPGHGSTFFVALPEVPLADAPPADVRDAAAAP